MKVLVLGASGMAGHTISIYLEERGYTVTTVTRSKTPIGENITGDVLEENFLRNILKQDFYDYIINCIGILNSECDLNPSKAVYLNSYLPHFLVDNIKSSRTKLIHLSTDCVFSGDGGPYKENSFKDGKTFYDLTKSLGEVNDNKNLTFRNSIIGPDISESGIGLFNWFMKQDEIEGYDRVFWSGITTLTLAKGIEKAMKDKLAGVYHLVNGTKISKYELLIIFNDIFKQGKVKITPKSNIEMNKHLINTRIDFDFQIPSYEQMIVEMRDWIMAHKEFYPHYFNNK